MPSCSHLYGTEHGNCPQPTAGEGGRCLWHNSGVRKGDAYVPDLLVQADRLASGDLAEFHLAGLVWPRASLPLRNLRGADLADAFLDGADLGGCDLSGASLRRASLKNADLHGARLRGCDLSSTNLSGADLRGADLAEATLNATVLLGADLRGASLAGAQVSDFRWNRLTRFAGVTGLEAGRAIGDQDATQAYLTPLALGGGDGEVSALSDSDPAALKTRVFAPLPPSASTVAAIMLVPASAGEVTHAADAAKAAASPARRRRPVLLVAALVLLALGLGLCGGTLYDRLRSTAAPAAVAPDGEAAQRFIQERDGLQHQHEADLAEIRRLQGHDREHDDGVAAAKQEAAVRRAEAEQLRTDLRASENDVVRLRGADDRATVMAIKLAESQELNRDIARQTSRQDQLSRILADGVSRLQQDKEKLTAQRDQHVVDESRARQFESEATASRGVIASLGKERDELLGQNQKLLGELLGAQRDIERYLARVNATHLQDYLTEGDRRAALLPVVAGKPLALSGDYLLTLRVEAGAQPGSVSCQVVAQRPHGATNPEITVVLYDQEEHPLRRFSYSFPHIDDGRPFVSSATTVACDRFPAFVRVQVAPGLDDLAAHK